MALTVQNMIDHLVTTYNQIYQQSESISKAIADAGDAAITKKDVSAAQKISNCLKGQVVQDVQNNFKTIMGEMNGRIVTLQTPGIEQSTAKTVYDAALKNATAATDKLNAMKSAFGKIGIKFSSIALLITAGIGLAVASGKVFGGERV